MSSSLPPPVHVVKFARLSPKAVGVIARASAKGSLMPLDIVFGVRKVGQIAQAAPTGQVVKA